VRLPLQRSEEPRLEFDLAHDGIDLSKAQRIDVRLYAPPPPTRLAAAETKVDADLPVPRAPTERAPAKD
jgi:hypothetical protein